MESTREKLQNIINSTVDDLFTIISRNLKIMSFADIVQTTQAKVNNLIMGKELKLSSFTFMKGAARSIKGEQSSLTLDILLLLGAELKSGTK